MMVYVVFNPNEEMVKICKDIPTALAWVNCNVSGSYRVSRDEQDIYVRTDEGTYAIIPWHVLE